MNILDYAAELNDQGFCINWTEAKTGSKYLEIFLDDCPSILKIRITDHAANHYSNGYSTNMTEKEAFEYLKTNLNKIEKEEI